MKLNLHTHSHYSQHPVFVPASRRSLFTHQSIYQCIFVPCWKHKSKFDNVSRFFLVSFSEINKFECVCRTPSREGRSKSTLRLLQNIKTLKCYHFYILLLLVKNARLGSEKVGLRWSRGRKMKNCFQRNQTKAKRSPCVQICWSR